MGTEAAGVLGCSVLNIFEYAGRNPGVPIDDAHVEAVFHRFAHDVGLLCRRDTDEFLDLFGKEDVNCLGLQFRLSLRNEEERAETVISGPPLDSEHDLADVAVADTLHDDAKKRLDLVRSLRAAAEGLYCNRLEVASTNAVVVGPIPGSPVRTRLTVAVDTPAAAATSRIVTRLVAGADT